MATTTVVLNLFFLILGFTLQNGLFFFWLYKMGYFCKNSWKHIRMLSRSQSNLDIKTETKNDNPTTKQIHLDANKNDDNKIPTKTELSSNYSESNGYSTNEDSTSHSKSLSYQSRKTKKKKVAKKTLRLATVSVGIGTIYTYWLSIFYIIALFDVNVDNIVPVGSLFIFGQRYFLFIYYLRRLHKSFKGNIYMYIEHLILYFHINVLATISQANINMIYRNSLCNIIQKL